MGEIITNKGSVYGGGARNAGARREPGTDAGTGFGGEFPIGFEQLCFLNENGLRVVDPGTFEIMVGSRSADVKTLPFEVVG